MAKKKKMDRINLRVTKDQKEILSRAAVPSRVSMMKEAKKAVSKRETIVLTGKDRDLFYSLLKKPPAPNKNLIKLMRNQSR